MTLAFLNDRGVAGENLPATHDDRLEKILGRLSRNLHAGPDEIGFVAGVLVATASQRVRHVATLALIDMNARDAADSILAVLRRPELVRSSGTLLYALGELGVPLDCETFIRIIEDGAFEGRAMALQLLENGLVECHTDPDLGTLKAKLLHMARRNDGSEASEAAEAALAHLPSDEDAADA